jgi:tRNA U34 5-carboxymethylaminomethyl modifying enzyme MnmG/GidA
MVGRRGEWVQVQLAPELRKTGIQMRWYKNETSGWMHDSTVEFVTPETKPGAN